MGYTTKFEGRFKFSRQLTEEQAKEIFKFTTQRHDNKGEKIALGVPMPGIWCDWVPVRDAHGRWLHLAWNGGEKFYDYIEWLYTLDALFFSVWGVKVSGSVKFQGEQVEDRGTITAKDGEYVVKPRKVGYIPPR